MYVEIHKYREGNGELCPMLEDGCIMYFDDDETICDAREWLGSLAEESVDEIERYNNGRLVGVRYKRGVEWFIEAISKEEWREEKGTMNKAWYAVMTDDREEAEAMVRRYKEDGHTEAYIAVIKEGKDPVCIGEIR